MEVICYVLRHCESGDTDSYARWQEKEISWKNVALKNDHNAGVALMRAAPL